MLQTLLNDPQWTVVALDYELGYLLEPKSAPPGWLPGRQPLARFWRFANRVSLTKDEASLCLTRWGSGSAGVGALQPAIDMETYTSAVNRIKRLIFEGDCYQVNFTFPLEFDWFGSPFALYARLREHQPVRYGGFVGDDRHGLVSLSPELFLERRADRLLTKPMKGTAPRSETPEQLRNSEKDCAENLMIVDLLRNDLGRVAKKGSVVVERLFDIEEYPTLWQMVSEISADVAGRSFGEILCAIFPCGSITGAPKIRAMQIAAGLEKAERGIYTGALGWLAPDGDFRLNVAIRTLELGADGRGKLGLGSGIVADSQPDAEWHECQLKSKFLRDCDPGLQLIETLRRDDGVYPMWAGHFARLKRSAAYFGFPVDEQLLFKELGRQPTKGTWRVRLTLDKAGAMDVQAVAFDGAAPEVRVAALAERRIDSRDVLRRHKTTVRPLYDAALRSLPADSPVFDLVFLNERGEVAEGARSNVFVERDGVLLTPPLDSGALPGVLRASFLASGKAREAVLWPDDLADGFWLGNALRGLVRVTLQR
ncbi:MAG: aminodeoxychorismate synthase component I [Dechloromonas sp.]|nr:aminodeoxychorismate synthase component I [Dechloromonas sp.]